MTLEEEKIYSFLKNHPILDGFLKKLEGSQRRVLKTLIVIDQAEVFFSDLKKDEESFVLLKELAKTLVKIDDFYEPLGGIVGYHKKFLELLKEKPVEEKVLFLEPSSIDLSQKTMQVQEYIDIGINSLPLLAEIYPLGGAGDRLNLIDEKTKEPLPQAKLKFLGKTIIEHLILDLKAREYLYFKNFREKKITPLVIMTSDVKDNHYHVIKIFEENNYFDRPKDSLFFIKQLSVPLIDENGTWVLESYLKPALRPGGHGVLWNLMNYYKVFDWLHTKQREKAIVRQINNLVAAVDYNLLAFSGYGIKENKAFGFAACPRVVKTAEGIDVLKEKKIDIGYEYGLCNIEYTEFAQHGFLDAAQKDQEYYVFPSNTNTLFIDLKEVEKASKRNPFPGITINVKKISLNNQKEVKAGRLELLMQSVAENFKDYLPHQITQKEKLNLSTFITNNERRKTIAAIKHQFEENKALTGTPIGAYFDIQQNYRDILSNYCKFTIPLENSLENFLKKGPSFFCYFNPFLGPMYEDIGEKIQEGKIKPFSELFLDLAEVEIDNLDLDGSLLIYANVNHFEKEAKCILKNVTVKNEGLEKEALNKDSYWEGKVSRKEALKIILQENSIFEAENVEFKENLLIEVPKDYKITAYKEDDELKFEKNKIIK